MCYPPTDENVAVAISAAPAPARLAFARRGRLRACGDISDLDMYLRHFADDKGVALEKLLQHLELYDHGAG